MQLLADENIPLLDEYFAGFGSLRRLPGRQISRADLQHTEVLLVRSVTRVDRELLQGTPVRFVGTCTIGTDHLDLDWLASAGIRVASAPGCNARGVVEYVLSCLLTLGERTATDWRRQRIGIVGVGEVGGRLYATLQALGVDCLRCDPLRAERGESGFVSLQQLIAEADVLSLHVPLTSTGAHATRHLLDAGRLAALRPGAWLINSSRGPVVDNAALLACLQQRPDLQVALDVWEHEPEVDPQLAAHCALATPHIAGYSLDGKLRGSDMIYRALCQHLQQPASLSLQQLAPDSGHTCLQVAAGSEADWLLARALRWVYDVRDDDARMRAMLGLAADAAQRQSGFDRLRRDYPLRRECAALDLQGELPPAARQLLRAAGFSC